MSQQDLQAAIASLDASTTAIYKQGELLRVQRRYVESVKGQRFQTNERSRTKRLASQNLTLAVEESNQALTSRFRELEEGVRNEINEVASSAKSYLHHDDCYLQHLAAMSVLDADDSKELRAKAAKLTAKLGDLTREEIEGRLDRVYLQQLVEKGSDRTHEQDELEEQELEQGLKSLHVEIPDVASMATLQDFQAPLLRAFAEQENGRNDRARNALEDISKGMSALTEAAKTCVSRLEALQSYQATLSAYQADLSAPAQRSVTDVDAEKQGRALRKEVVSPPMKDVLQHWNVLMLENGSVEAALWARKRKLEQDVHQSSTAFEDALGAHLNCLPTNSEQLLETDISADGDLLEFEREMEKLRDAVDRVDLACIDAEDETQARLMARWAESTQEQA